MTSHWLSECYPKDLGLLRHLIRMMRRHDLTKKRDKHKDEYKDRDNDKDNYNDKDIDKDKDDDKDL